MSKYSKLELWFKQFVAAISTVWAVYLNKELATYQLTTTENLLLTVLGVALLARLMQSLLPYCFDRSKWLRARVLENEFIEGKWIDVVYDKFSGVVLYCAVISVSYKEGALVCKGNLFNCAGQKLGVFSSEHTKFDKMKLSYVFGGHSINSFTTSTSGMGELNFHSADDGIPCCFNGYFVNTAHNTLYCDGYRLAKDEILALKELNGRQQVIQKYISLFLMDCPSYRKATESELKQIGNLPQQQQMPNVPNKRPDELPPYGQLAIGDGSC